MSIELAALRIGFIGAGRVAQTLAPAFAPRQFERRGFLQPRSRCGTAPGIPGTVSTADAACARGRGYLRYGLLDGERRRDPAGLPRFALGATSSRRPLQRRDRIDGGGSREIRRSRNRRISSNADVCKSRRRARGAARMHRRYRSRARFQARPGAARHQHRMRTAGAAGWRAGALSCLGLLCWPVPDRVCSRKASNSGRVLAPARPTRCVP